MSEATKESYHGDILVRVPAAWVDKTVLLFEAPSRDPHEFTPRFLVTRHRRDGNESIQTYAQRLVKLMSARFEDFEIVKDEPSRLANRAAQWVLFRWKSPSGPVTQQHLFVPGAGRTILNLCSAALTSDFDRYSDTFNEILGSVRLADEDVGD